MLHCKPIGVVVREWEPPRNLDVWTESELLMKSKAVIRVHREFCEGLRGLSAGRYVWVIWYADRAGECGLLVHPFHDDSLPETGVFSTRSPCRPNPLGLSLVKIVEVDGCNLTVLGLDAWNGTPVLDIKPYTPGLDDPRRVGQIAVSGEDSR